MNHKILFLAGALALLTCATPSANAWGCKGHQTVALIAENHLTPEARQLVQKLLGENPIDPKLKRWCGNATTDLMVDASTWPDDVRNERKNGPWHYIDIPRGKQKGELSEYCGAEGCVTRAIEEQRAILKDKSADPLKRAEALRYIIHFVGDMHQPLHAINNADNGGNCVAVKYFRHEPLANSCPSRTGRLFAQSSSDMGHGDFGTRHGSFQSAAIRQRTGREVSRRERRLGSCGHPRGQLGVGEPRARGDSRSTMLSRKKSASNRT